jgi:cis-L-3-hydroxyproline dehydratase
MAENVNKYLKDGYRKFQLKVGGNPSDDIARIRAVRELLDVKTKELRESSKAKVRGGLMKEGDYDESNLYIPLLCDANTGWLAHEAVKVRTCALPSHSTLDASLVSSSYYS